VLGKNTHFAFLTPFSASFARRIAPENASHRTLWFKADLARETEYMDAREIIRLLTIIQAKMPEAYRQLMSLIKTLANTSNAL